MMPYAAGPYVDRSGPDYVGFAAFVAAPAVALYRGVTVAFGVLYPLDDFTAVLLPLLIIAGCLLFRFPNYRRAFASRSVRRATLFLVGYLVVVLVSTLLVYVDPIERDPTKMSQQFFSAAVGILVFVVMVSAPSLPAAARSLRLSLFVWAVAAILTPLTALTPFPIGEMQGAELGSEGMRSFGVLGDGGTFVVSCLAVAFFMSRKMFWFALAMLALILSGSRSALIVAAAGIGAIFVLARPSSTVEMPGSRAIRVLVAAVASVFLLVIVQVVFGVISQKLGFLNAFERLNETQFTDTDRSYSIEQGIEWFKLSPLYGNGFNSYFYFSFRSAAFGVNQSNALNQIVQTLVDGGVLGLIALVLFFWEVVRPGRGSLVDRRTDPFGLRIWLLVFLTLNHTAVYILPASYLTILVFGVCGIALHAREAAGPAAMRRHAQGQRLPAPRL